MTLVPAANVGPATTQNLVVKFDGEICGGVLVENASDDFPSKRSSKISFQTSPEVRHQFRRKLRQIHSGNRWYQQQMLQLTPCLRAGMLSILMRGKDKLNVHDRKAIVSVVGASPASS